MPAVTRVAASTGQQHTSSLYSGQRHTEVNYGPERVQNVGIVADKYVGDGEMLTVFVFVSKCGNFQTFLKPFL